MHYLFLLEILPHTHKKFKESTVQLSTPKQKKKQSLIAPRDCLLQILLSVF
jgi:hypothetical protein